MGLARTKDTVMRNGEFSQASGITYYQGSPAAIDADGNLDLALNNELTASTQSFVGIFRNTSAYDATMQDDKAAVFIGHSIVTFQKNIANTNNSSINNDGAPGYQTGDDYPYATAPSTAWNEAQKLYIGADGKWTNAAASESDPHYGCVLKVGSNYLSVLLYGTPAYE